MGLPWDSMAISPAKMECFGDIFEYSWYDTIMCAANIHMVGGNGRIANIYIYI